MVQRQISQRETQEREPRGLSPDQQVEKSRKGNGQDQNHPSMLLKFRASPPQGVTTEAENQKVCGKPRGQSPTIGQPGKWREQQRNLRPIERNVQTIRRLRHQLPRQLCLRTHVVQQVAAALPGQASQSVEVQKICAFDQTVPVQRSRRRHIHGVDSPEAHGEQ